jgi:hypothetical protein
MDSILLFNNLLEKYKNSINSSYLKYNFLIEFHSIFKGNFKLSITIKEKKTKNIKYPIKEYKSPSKQIKKPYFLVSNIFYFLINDEFTSDIELLLIKKIDNESSIFNNLIINMDNYEIVCNCFKTRLISKMSNLKKYEEDEILYEYDIYKLYDGINISLYYYNKQWNIAGFDKIDISKISSGSSNLSIMDKFNEIMFKYIMSNQIDINISTVVKNFKELLNNEEYKRYIENYDTKLRGNEFTEYFNESDIMKYFYNNLDKKYTYNFVLINKNYNLCSKKDKIKFMNKIHKSSFDIIYIDNMFQDIYVKKINNLKNNQKNGLIFISKNNNEDRIIFYNNYYNLNKLLYSHIKKNIFDINMIILKNIILYKINKELFMEIFNKYTHIYNNINKKINILVDYLYEYIIKINIKIYMENEFEHNVFINENFINIILNFIKKNKDLSSIFFLEDNPSHNVIINFKENYYYNKELYKKLLKDRILDIDIINDLYLYIFN